MIQVRILIALWKRRAVHLVESCGMEPSELEGIFKSLDL